MSNDKKLKKTRFSGVQAIFGDDVLDEISRLEKQIEQSPNNISTTKINISKIIPNPYQPRIFFDDKKIAELGKSIENYGIFTPLILKPTKNDNYYIIAGERRFRAAKLVGLKTVPAVLVDFQEDKMMEVAILENIQRENLNTIEEANAYKNVMKHSQLTQEQVAKKFGKSRSYVANILRILNLPIEIQKYVEQGKLSMGHVKPLVSLNNKELMIKIAERAINENLPVRTVENIINGHKLSQFPRKSKNVEEIKELRYATSLLRKKLSSKVKITNNEIVISYKGQNHLNDILEKMGVIDLEWD